MTIRVLKYLVLLAFVLLIVAISSFWFYGPSFREKDVVLELGGPTQVKSGEEVVYKLKYDNQTRSTLHNLKFTFSYPEGSTLLVDGQVTENYTEKFELEELMPGVKGEKEFKAFLIGERGDIKVAKIEVEFSAGSLTSTFEKSVTLSATIVSTPIDLTLVASPNIISGGLVDYILDYRNGSDEDAVDLMVEFNYPDGLRFSNFSPSPGSGNNTWLIKSLKKGSGGRISVSGVLTGNEGDHKIVSVKLKRKIGGDYVDYQTASADTVISNPLLGLEVSANNSSDYSASLGERLNYVLKYSNNYSESIINLNLTLKLEGDMFDLSSIDTRGGLFDESSRTITWNSSVILAFYNLPSNANGQVNFSVNLKSSFPSNLPGSSQDRFVKVSAKLGTFNVPPGVDGNEVSISASNITKIGTQPTFNQYFNYDENNKAFRIYWQLTNPGNEFQNVKVMAKLPADMEWVGETQTTENQVSSSFDSGTSEISWNLAKLPYGTGVVTPKYEASFIVKAKADAPTVILENSRFFGQDSFTKQEIIINRGNLNQN
ncbi:MAG: hypothetical protein A3B86_03985 [Candidatus Yanofskybacteria bacterium RIFCSPHIGHO2_02_FULL_38_22b]|uniref:DUF11 domain-containing protein n=1 Tax=Candidatus Yanofskybacteria bacterium RIFCSPHIGHO2_02_FULL_38_22b TaxID=1802673 RepID=A0A1F8EZE7_9BACT|nr:MAG: hypothetical protein A2816_01755 [Candidatus Yanofskybacteria bacterium RIFCSPHIGHO2_01_FULL_39_44]OGN06251.1 MAG: hypothetical protein A3B86_03985 [Candidatus Yanofskybacteria bacterium RIFCSPHIGHO2_02_FULL_38_22b]OGN19671.1 MAG: hypothetical protein A2910_03720 [Candidatus Yanofskybacteria bacterium RIFCSPLOWO2_01_FULL_39_28]